MSEFNSLVTKQSNWHYDLKSNKDSVKKLLTELLKLPIEISDVKITEPDLETIIKQIYQWKN